MKDFIPIIPVALALLNAIIFLTWAITVRFGKNFAKIATIWGVSGMIFTVVCTCLSIFLLMN